MRYNFYMILLFIESCQADVAFNHLKSQDIDLFSSARSVSAKQWKVYIEVFLARKIVNRHFSNANVLVFFKNFHFGQTFAILAKRLAGSKLFVDQINISTIKFILIKYKRSPYKLLVIKWATGQLYLAQSSIVEKPYHIFFNVDKTLSLNITFIQLKFYLEELYLCDASGILIFKKKPNVDKIDYCPDDDTYAEYTFCKHYATFNFYPKFNQLCIKNRKYNDNFVYPFQLSFQFSVTDNKLIETVRSRRGKSLVLLSFRRASYRL